VCAHRSFAKTGSGQTQKGKGKVEKTPCGVSAGCLCQGCHHPIPYNKPTASGPSAPILHSDGAPKSKPFWRNFILRITRSICQDRLGTHIGKDERKEWRIVRFGAGGWAGFILDNTQGNASVSITALGTFTKSREPFLLVVFLLPDFVHTLFALA
jgi:hypothetical protein